MKIRRSSLFCPRRKRGILLMDCLVYISLVTVVLGIGTVAFFKCWDANKALRRNADDIVRALHAGEQWRADIRSANGPIRQIQDGDSDQLRIPAVRGEIVYALSDGALRRRTAAGQDTLLLSGVIHSSMRPDARPRVTAWCWELELSRTRRASVVKPVFTFEAVPEHPVTP